MTSRGWCFTSYLESEPVFKEDCCKYLIYQKEKCPKTGNIHWQGYAEFKNSKRRGGAQKELEIGKSHCEPRKGTPKEASEYCEKSNSRVGEPKIFGELSKGQGERSDLNEFARAVFSGVKDEELEESWPGHCLRYEKSVERVRAKKMKIRDWPMEVIIIWGPSGVGKTREVFEKEKESLYIKQTDNHWWDMYQGEEAILIDDVDWNDLSKIGSRSWWLQFMDRYPMLLPVKGGTVKMCSKRIYITSNKSPAGWMSKKEIARRVTEVCDRHEVGGNTDPNLE